MVKDRTFTACDRKALDRLRKAVVNRYGQTWGHLREEVDKALQERAKEMEKELEEVR
jgi:hypothetical protein